jgi:SAM-dependent methyltransferase
MAPPPKPDCWAPELATPFELDVVARSYVFRPPYGANLFAKLASLVGDEPRTVLDLGCGPGDLARYLVPLFDRVDAVDVSAAMIGVGRTLEHGDAPNLRWVRGRAEDAPLDPPYALVVAGDSLHWMDWFVIVPRIRDMLSPNGWLAIAGKEWGTGTPEERELWARYSTNQANRPVHLIDELESRGLFEKRGTEGFTAGWTPTIDEYLAANRSRASYPTVPERAEAFDGELRAVLERLLDGDRLRLTVRGGFAWGVPLVPAQ